MFLSEYHYLGTRKPNKRIYPAITEWRVHTSAPVESNLKTTKTASAKHHPGSKACLEGGELCTAPKSKMYKILVNFGWGVLDELLAFLNIL